MTRIEFRMHDAHMSDKGDMVVAGYVNKTEELSQELGIGKRFKEKIKKGSFERALKNTKNDIDFLAEHDSNVVLASTKNSTLELREDDNGLYMEAQIINTSAGRDWYEMITSGLITNMSFGFRSLKDEWRTIGKDLYERSIEELELFEVSAVRTPAYAQSTISSRGLNTSDDEIVPDNIKEDEKMEQRSVDELYNAITSLTEEVRELRGTIGKDKDGNDVSAQKDNYAVGQQTAKQAENENDLKRIKKDEDNNKYFDDKEIDGKGSYNHDTKVKSTDEDGKQTNQPESETDDRLKEFDGSDPDEVPGKQNHESSEGEDGGTEEPKPEVPDTEEPETEEEVVNEGESQERSISFESFERKMRELRGGK